MRDDGFMGAIQAGHRVIVTLAMDGDAQRSASVEAGFVPSSGEAPPTASNEVAPGHREHLTLAPAARGVLEIRVEMESESDVGTLTMEVAGVPEQERRIAGSTVWKYEVVVDDTTERSLS